MIEKKGLKVNMGKTKVILRGEGSKRMISGMDPCGVSDKRVNANSGLYLGCQSGCGVKGALKQVEGTFKCKRCVNGVVNRRQRQV